jgi:hypothetical protein
MATRHFEKSQMATFPESGVSSLWMNGYAMPLRLARVHTVGVSPNQRRRQQVAVADWQALGRGVRWAFAIEGGTALLIYGMWCLLRLLM